MSHQEFPKDAYCLFVCLFGDLRGGEISFVYLSMPSKLQLTPENAGPKKACSTNSHFSLF